MSSTLFTTDDGDVILRAGPLDPGTKHDFCVHKLILSLASPVFKDMFAFPQPPDQTLGGQHQLPVIDIPDPPEVLDKTLRFIYPGVEPPKITEPQTLTALLSMADKYNIASIYPPLREILKTFIMPRESLWVHIVACRFGFSEVMKEAAKVLRADDFMYFGGHEDLRHISSIDLFRLVQFVQTRAHQGRLAIQTVFDPSYLEGTAKCTRDGEDAQNYYFHLGKAVEDVFAHDPCVGSGGLFAVLDTIPDPPLGCKPPQGSAELYHGGGNKDAFDCPLQPMTIRRRLSEVADELSFNNDKMLDQFFGKGSGSS